MRVMRFLIMNGAGNRFAVFDARGDVEFRLSEEKVDACGNATRCIGWLYMRDAKVDSMVLETNAGLLLCAAAGENQVAVDMGPPKLDWNQIPLKEVMHTHHVDVKIGPIDNPVLHNPGAVNMGNPHCVFFVEDFTAAKPDKVGPMIEYVIMTGPVELESEGSI